MQRICRNDYINESIAARANTRRVNCAFTYTDRSVPFGPFLRRRYCDIWKSVRIGLH